MAEQGGMQGVVLAAESWHGSLSLSNSSHSHFHDVEARLQDGKRRACQGLLDCVCASQVAGRTCPVGLRLLVALGDWPL